MKRFFYFLLLFSCLFNNSANAQSIKWQRLEPGFYFTEYEIPSDSLFLRSSILILKFSLSNFEIAISQATDFSKRQTSVKKLAKKQNALAAINASFYDKEGNALGLIAKDGEFFKAIHRGGKLLTGIFYIKNRIPKIVHRNSFNEPFPEIAIQAGPRLIERQKPLLLSDRTSKSRRSGIAITKDKEILIYATIVRFPGASLSEIQKMLLLPELRVVDALNLDGGGSSQLYIDIDSDIIKNNNISGGDDVPNAIVIKRR